MGAQAGTQIDARIENQTGNQAASATRRDEGFVVVRTPAQISAVQGLPYYVGLSNQTAGAKGISMNLVVIPPAGAAEAHSHSDFETAIYLIRGRVLCRYGEHLARSAVIEPGDFLYIGPNVWHQPINLSESEEALAVVARNDPSEQEHVILADDGDRAA